ncbi:non-homologous end joining protein Ku [Patulibacter sp. S7RM1-6]
MARSLWTGSLSFGLVNVPVQLVSATRDLDVHFHQVQRDTGERVETRRVAVEDGEEVDWEDVAKGWETEDGELVVLTDEDFASAQPEKTRTVDIDLFVDLADIDPINFDHPYWLLPAGEGEGAARAYRLLVEVMGQAGQVAIGRIVLRAKEYLVALREQDGLLSLTTMLFADEIRDPQDTGAIPSGTDTDPSKAEVDDAVALIEELTDDFDPARYDDCHRVRLLRLIDEKREGGEIEIPEIEPEPKPQKAPADLIAALEDSLAKARGGSKGKKAAGAGKAGTRSGGRKTSAA